MEELRSWQALVSLWDRMRDRRLHMHEAPSTFEIDRPAREGWLMRRSKSAGVFAEWRRQWAVLKRAHLFLYDRYVCGAQNKTERARRVTHAVQVGAQ